MSKAFYSISYKKNKYKLKEKIRSENKIIKQYSSKRSVF